MEENRTRITDACKTRVRRNFVTNNRRWKAASGLLHAREKEANTAEEKGSAFTSKQISTDCCDEENIHHLQIATGVPRGNGQVERIHRIFESSSHQPLSLDDSTKCAGTKYCRQIAKNTKQY
ncbi:hypothetical protein TNCV_3076361 [Trichonephila clavipes]|nr:hypothetical protein TNCV_3076361 [Trichonephila clavipes]